MDNSSSMATGPPRAPPQDPIFAIVNPALKVGAACGAGGFLFGGIAGILKDTAPFLFATTSGIQTFALGTTFSAIRTGIIQTRTTEAPKAQDLTIASTASGGISGGAIALLTRGRSNALPAMLMFSLFGFLGQVSYNGIVARRERIADEPPKPGFWRRMSEKSFSPVKIMTNEEYKNLLEDKKLKVEVEISILDDKIAALIEEQQREEARVSNTEQKEK